VVSFPQAQSKEIKGEFMNIKKALSIFLLFSLICLITIVPLRGATTHSVALSWSADSTATGGFNIYRGTVSGGPYTAIGNVPAGTLTYSDTTGTGGVEYYYVITALDTASPPDESAYSNQVSASFLVNPAAPAGLAAVAK
jgi:hypothetical protein